MLKLEALGVEVRHAIIDSFTRKFQQRFELNETQAFKIVTARPASQPLFLRTVLYALQLGVEMGGVGIDDQLEMYLAADSPDALISQILDQCASYVEAAGSGPHHGGAQPAQSILGATLSVIYVSRCGLTDDEIWGAVHQMLGHSLTGAHKDVLRRILQDFCMTVNGSRMFTHAAVENAVYDKYITSPEHNVKLHQMMARYFNRIQPPSDRKLQCLVWHLEVSGSWSKLKSVLVDIDNFNLWWSESNRTEFINLWASLTNYAQRGKEPVQSLVTGQFREKRMRYNQVPRPYCDVVEEYTKAVDEFRLDHRDEDEVTCKAIMDIAEFFLEFAMLGHEALADVPDYIHPEIPTDDMKSLGVPYLDQQRDGLSILVKPQTEVLGRDEKGNVVVETAPGGDEVPLAANDDMPCCSTYFFRRWMWIQFPLISLANCGDKYSDGIQRAEDNRELKHGPSKKKSNAAKGGRKGKKKGMLTSQDDNNNSNTQAAAAGATNPSLTRSSSSQNDQFALDTRTDFGDTSSSEVKLPTIDRGKSGYARRGKRSRTEPRIPRKIAETTSAKDEIMGLAEREEKKIMNEISELREEYDNLVQQTGMLKLVKEKVDTSLTAVLNMEFAATAGIERHETVVLKLSEVEEKWTFQKQLKSNYAAILKMCARHPAQALALIEELESKLRADTVLIDQIRGLLREELYENVATANYYRSMKKAVSDSMSLHHRMIKNRLLQQHNLDEAGKTEIEHPRNGTAGGGTGGTGDALFLGNGTGTGGRSSPGGMYGASGALSVPQSASSDSLALTAAEIENAYKYAAVESIVEQNTGYSDVNSFLQRFLSQPNFDLQLKELRFNNEERIRVLKGDLSATNKELQVVQTTISGTSGQETKSKGEKLTEAQTNLKRVKEKADGAEMLYRSVRTGLENIAATVGIPHPHPDTSVHEIMNQCDTVLEILMDEKDKTSQKNLAESHAAGAEKEGAGRRFSVAAGQEVNNRPPELDAALAAHNQTKSKMAAKFYCHQPAGDEKNNQEPPEKGPDQEAGELGENRKAIKKHQERAVRAHQKKRDIEAATAVGVP